MDNVNGCDMGTKLSGRSGTGVAVILSKIVAIRPIDCQNRGCRSFTAQLVANRAMGGAIELETASLLAVWHSSIRSVEGVREETNGAIALSQIVNLIFI